MNYVLILFLMSLPFTASAFDKVFEPGVYKGLAPTDESAVQMGEVQLDVVTDQTAAIRIATGLKVQEEHIDLTQLVPLTPEEARGRGIQNAVAYKPFNREFPLIVLNHKLPSGILNKLTGGYQVAMSRILHSPAITVYTGGLGDLMMPVFLYSPSQVARGYFDKAVDKIEHNFGQQGVIPKVGFGGKALSNSTCTFLLHTYGRLDPNKE